MTERELPCEGPFVIDEYRLDGAVVELDYHFGDIGARRCSFTERIEFPAPLVESPELHRVLRVLHLLAGTSYYKSIAPTRIITGPLSSAERDLVSGMYDGGLREFAYRNGLPLPLPVDLDVVLGRDGGRSSGSDGARLDGDASVDVMPEPVSDRVLIPVGGGKDSALVADLIPEGELMTVNPTGVHERFAELLGRPLVSMRRTLDPGLRELVERGALNGHVPVTAINSAIAAAWAVSEGFGYVAMGLERSASEPTLVCEGVEVNHQYSKSAEGERLLRAAFAPSGVVYFSLLRPLTELSIGEAVARRGLAGDIVSCNRAFTIWTETEASRTQRPCGDCAKCLFTSLMLAPALSPEQIGQYFGRDLLDEEDHVDAVRELWSAEKPFDCVGERHETAAALVLLSESSEWADQIVPARLADEARAVLAENSSSPDDYLRIGSTDDLPERFRQLIDSLDDTGEDVS